LTDLSSGAATQEFEYGRRTATDDLSKLPGKGIAAQIKRVQLLDLAQRIWQIGEAVPGQIELR